MNIIRFDLEASVCWGGVLPGMGSLLAEEKPTGLAKWEAEIQKFESADKVTAPVPGGVVFYGSSSARLWDLKTSFPNIKSN